MITYTTVCGLKNAKRFQRACFRTVFPSDAISISYTYYVIVNRNWEILVGTRFAVKMPKVLTFNLLSAIHISQENQRHCKIKYILRQNLILLYYIGTYIFFVLILTWNQSSKLLEWV